jgi:hypothetical protein
MASVLEVGWLKKEICDALGEKGQGTSIIGRSKEFWDWAL